MADRRTDGDTTARRFCQSRFVLPRTDGFSRGCWERYLRGGRRHLAEQSGAGALLHGSRLRRRVRVGLLLLRVGGGRVRLLLLVRLRRSGRAGGRGGRSGRGAAGGSRGRSGTATLTRHG